MSQFSASAIVFVCSEATGRISKPTQPPFRSVPFTLSSEVKRQQREDSNHLHLLPSSEKCGAQWAFNSCAGTIDLTFYLNLRRSTSARLDPSLLLSRVYSKKCGAQCTFTAWAGTIDLIFYWTLSRSTSAWLDPSLLLSRVYSKKCGAQCTFTAWAGTIYWTLLRFTSARLDPSLLLSLYI